MRYPRLLLKKIDKQITTREIIVVTGMRRVGKTTLLRMIYDKIKSKNKVLLDVENIIEQKIFEEMDYNNIWQNLKPYGITHRERAYIFLDEIQAKPGIVLAVKYLYDHYDVKFFITGSSSFYMKNLFPESLAGRKIVFELFPLNFEEFLVFKENPKEFQYDFPAKNRCKNLIGYEKYKKYFEDYLAFGGFPQVVLAQEEEQKKLYLKDIITSYFEMDVKRMADFHQITAFRDLMLLLAQRTGSKLEITGLASEIGVSRSTVYSYLSFLEKTYFIFLISPFGRSVSKEVRGTKKIYFCDNGILNQLGKLDEGRLLENAVFHNVRTYGKVNYYQRRSGVEMDFVLPEKNLALEVKRKGNLRDYHKLSNLADSLGITDYYVVSQSFSPENGIIPVTEL
ncbi:MAG: ATP-binding protein [Candidatus Aminicenantes bacterium]|nr:MAG: ATP-binding protein [Candidatus Aminicenantes bacterium]